MTKQYIVEVDADGNTTQREISAAEIKAGSDKVVRSLQAGIRQERNFLLERSDLPSWCTLPGSPIDPKTLYTPEVLKYRQELRDLTKTKEFKNIKPDVDFVYPTKPNDLDKITKLWET